MSLTRRLFSRKFFLVNLVLIGIMIGFAAAFVLLAGGTVASSPALAHADTIQPPTLAQESALAHAEAMQVAFNYVAESVLPSVVELSVIGTSTVSPTTEFPWRFFFGNPEEAPEERQPPRQFEERGLGSGIIVRRTGNKVYVLTNNHVVAGARDITVKMYDEREFKATLVGADARRDLAVVMFETTASDIRVAVLGNSDKLRVGDWAIAIGSPFGLFSSVTTGIISAIGRNGGPDGNISDFIQTDAAINRGNSGGALANIRGEVIGVNTWIASTTGGNVGLGFSIPINNAAKAINDIIAGGTVRYGWIGVLLNTMERASLNELGVGERRGALIGNVFSDGPAGRGGILPGDFVVAIDGRSIASIDQLVRIVGDLPVGRQVLFAVIRNGKALDVKVTIDERNDAVAADYAKLWPGMELTRLTPEVIETRKLPSGTKGVLVGNVIARSPAATLGMKVGDVITQINGKSVATLSDFYRQLNEDVAKSVQFTVIRDGQTLTTLALMRK
jgi:Do/DeqQ family serine protease